MLEAGEQPAIPRAALLLARPPSVSETDEVMGFLLPSDSGQCRGSTNVLAQRERPTSADLSLQPCRAKATVSSPWRMELVLCAGDGEAISRRQRCPRPQAPPPLAHP